MKRWTNGLPGAAKRLGAMMAQRGLSASQPGCAPISMTARSAKAPPQRPNTLLQLSRSTISDLCLATHGRAIHNGTELAAEDNRGSVAIGGKPDLSAEDQRERPICLVWPYYSQRDRDVSQRDRDVAGMHRYAEAVEFAEAHLNFCSKSRLGIEIGQTNTSSKLVRNSPNKPSVASDPKKGETE